MEFIFLCVFFAAWAGYVGSNRGENGFLWFLVGLFFGPFGVLASFFCGVKCPYCQKTINSKALKCPNCQSELYAPPLPPVQPPSLPAQSPHAVPPAQIIHPQAATAKTIDWKKAGLIAGGIAVVILIVVALAPDRNYKTPKPVEPMDSFVGKQGRGVGRVVDGGKATLTGLPYVNIVTAQGQNVKCYEPTGMAMAKGTPVVFSAAFSQSSFSFIVSSSPAELHTASCAELFWPIWLPGHIHGIGTNYFQLLLLGVSGYAGPLSFHPPQTLLFL